MTHWPELPERIRCDHTPAWADLRAHYAQEGARLDVRAEFARDPQRFAHFSVQAPHVFADLSKNLINARTNALLLALAQQCQLSTWRDAMWQGAFINTSEQRQVLHYLLRNQPSTWNGHEHPAFSGAAAQAYMPQVNSTLQAMLRFAQSVRDKPEITDVVNIGIGGSDLGPQMAVLALQTPQGTRQRFHFVSNVDGSELAEVLAQVRAPNTLFIVASKTFTTRETMTNARSARAWFVEQHPQGEEAVGAHFVALSSHVQAAQDFGIQTCFDFKDWVGGRYSLWSAIGLPIAIAIGAAGFEQMLAGAHDMDWHFAHAPLAHNLPVRLGLLDVWYRNFHGLGSRNIAPYHHGLRRLPAYLQQLEMESNGKSVDLHGHALGFDTAPVLWGEPGTNGQHAFFQMLHQGSELIPVEFIAVREPEPHAFPAHHTQLLANALAQAQALMQGRSAPEPNKGTHRHFSGNRPSTFLLLERMEPASLGALIALYEHRVFVSGAIWGVNSFDQWGVELGKQLAQDIEPRLRTGDTQGLDSSTAGLLLRMQQTPGG